MRWSWVLLLALERGCSYAPRPSAPVTVRVQPLAHPPGTLLRDAAGRYWVVARWPDREPIVDSMLSLAHYDLREAISLSAEEARCLRPSARVWFARFLWRLVRLPSGEFWYINEAQRYRRRASSIVITAWRERASDAQAWVGTHEVFEMRFRDLGPMPPPDGALFTMSGEVFYFVEGHIHRFASQELAARVGYSLTTAIPTSDGELRAIGVRGEDYTASTFQVCPLAAAQLRSTEDHDGDGVPFFRDCDDDDARRHPDHAELCDGIDNDCDLVVDNGFDVGFRCVMENACHTPAYTRCADHRLGTLCWDDEAVCSE